VLLLGATFLCNFIFPLSWKYSRGIFLLERNQVMTRIFDVFDTSFDVLRILHVLRVFDIFDAIHVKNVFDASSMNSDKVITGIRITC
jgi:hypothetical protein